MSRSFGCTSFTTRSPIRISPPEISSSPAIMRSRVDLPQPDGPTRTQNSPSAMPMSTPWTTGVEPNDLCTPLRVTAAISWLHLPVLAVAFHGHVHVLVHRAARRALIALCDGRDDRLVLADRIGGHHRVFELALQGTVQRAHALVPKGLHYQDKRAVASRLGDAD